MQLSIEQYLGNDEWSMAPLTEPVIRKVNRLLHLPEIQQLFHNATISYDALHRWDIFRHFRDRIPSAAKPLRNAEFVIPAQVDGSDWRFNDCKPGPSPKYWDYCLIHACHWMSVPWLEVAKRLFPQHRWDIVSSSLHTGITCLDQNVIFDPLFQTLNVSVDETLQLWLSPDDPDDCQIYVSGRGYADQLNDGTSSYAMRFWNLADTFQGSEEQLLETLNTFLDNEKLSESLGMTQNYGLTDNAHLNKDPEALLVLSNRSDQYE